MHLSRFLIVLLAAISVASAPAASLSPENSGADEQTAEAEAMDAADCSWSNYGVWQQAGDYSCAGSGTCSNAGIALQLGDFECETCSNHGVVAWVGSTCWGSSAAGACLDAVCVGDGGPQNSGAQLALTTEAPQPAATNECVTVVETGNAPPGCSEASLCAGGNGVRINYREYVGLDPTNRNSGTALGFGASTSGCESESIVSIER